MAQTRLIQDLIELVTPGNNDVFVIVDNTSNPSLSVTKKIKYESLKEDLQGMLSVFISGGTGVIASYDNANNKLTLSVSGNTTVQKTIISSGGTVIGTRQQLNFVKGNGISFTGSDDAGTDRVNLTVAVQPSEIDINQLSATAPLTVLRGGTGAGTAANARSNLGAAKSGSNSDITSITGLTTPLSIAQGGTGGSSAEAALKNLAGLKRIESVAVNGESLVSQGAFLNVSNEYVGQIKGIKAADTTITVTSGATDVSIAANSQNILNGATENVNFNGKRLTNLGSPQDASDAATVAYVDQAGAGLTVKEAVLVATASNILAGYSANKLTVAGTGVPSIDGVAITDLGTRVLIKNQTNSVTNGIYTLTREAATGISAQFTRATDYDSDQDVKAGTFTFVLSGNTNKSLQFVQTTPAAVLDTDPLIFTILNDTTVAENSIDNAKLSDMTALTIKGAVTNGNPQDLTPNQTIGILNSGTTLFAAKLLPTGSTTVTGIVQLYNGVDSLSASRAATAASVKTAYDKAVAANTVAAAKPSLAVVLALA